MRKEEVEGGREGRVKEERKERRVRGKEGTVKVRGKKKKRGCAEE